MVLIVSAMRAPRQRVAPTGVTRTLDAAVAVRPNGAAVLDRSSPTANEGARIAKTLGLMTNEVRSAADGERSAQTAQSLRS